MRVLAQKINQKTAFTIELIIGIIIMAAAVIVLPVSVFSIDTSLLTNWFVWLVVLVGVLFFGGVGFFCFARPYMRFVSLPEVQAETDGTYLYIHGKKEAKIPLDDMDGTYIGSDTPYIMTYEFILHLISERYGNVTIDVPGYGKYKLWYVSHAQEVPGIIAALIESR